MPKRTLERLTFEYLRAFDETSCARQAFEIIPIQRNRLIWIEAETRFEVAAEALREAISPTSISQYVQGLRDIANESVTAFDKKAQTKRRKKPNGQKKYLVDIPEPQED